MMQFGPLLPFIVGFTLHCGFTEPAVDAGCSDACRATSLMRIKRTPKNQELPRFQALPEQRSDLPLMELHMPALKNMLRRVSMIAKGPKRHAC